MKPFDVYPRYEIAPVKGEGFFIWDSDGIKYLDFYGGHAVISVGHSHPDYIRRISNQLLNLGFYSNSIKIPIQEELAEQLGKSSGYPNYLLFLCNSGAEANENALKLASFHTKRKKIIAFERGFHGRTSLAVAATDNKKVVAPVNETDHIIRLPLNDFEAFEEALTEEVAAVIVEGIQGLGGVYEPDIEFFLLTHKKCKENGTLLILDEVQSGYGRSGRFFAHQYANIKPDIISIAKGMGNGFPIGGIMIAPSIPSGHGMLGTTFGGNHLACAAGLAVLEVLQNEKLIENAKNVGSYLTEKLGEIPQVKEIRGKGLMIGIEMDESVGNIRKDLLFEHQIFTGSSVHPNTLRLLPPLGIGNAEVDQFVHAFKQVV